MAWQIATFTPRCFKGIFTLSGSGSPGFSDLIPRGKVLTLRCFSRCWFSVAASIVPSRIRYSDGGIPFGFVSSEDGAPFVARRAMNLHGCAPPFFLQRGYPRE